MLIDKISLALHSSVGRCDHPKEKEHLCLFLLSYIFKTQPQARETAQWEMEGAIAH